MRRIIALIMGAIVALFALTTPASAGGTRHAPAPTKVDCSKLPAPHMTEQCKNYTAPAPLPAEVRSLTIVIGKNKINVEGNATDQIAHFYRSKSGRTVHLTFRSRTTFIVAEYAFVKAVSSDGYGEDVFLMKAHAGKSAYRFISPPRTYVQFLYVEFPSTPVDTSASGAGSICNAYGCG